MVEFYSEKNINDLTYRIDYPSGPIEVIRDGRVRSQQSKQGDCMAMIYSSLNEISSSKMLELADTFQVEAGLSNLNGTLKPEIRNGTVIFQLPNVWLYMSMVRFYTKDGKSFTENKNRVIGKHEIERVVIRYLPHCKELED